LKSRINRRRLELWAKGKNIRLEDVFVIIDGLPEAPRRPWWKLW